MSASALSVVNPFTEQIEFDVPLLPAGDVDGIVRDARDAHEAFRGTEIGERLALCERFLAAVRDRSEELARDVTRQMGKPLSQARNEVSGVIERSEYMMSIAERSLCDEMLPEKEGFSRYIRHEPKGVVLDIAAWNYPLLIAVNVVVPAVLAGNAVIVKHSSKTPLCGEAFARAFAEAGAPEHLVQNIVTGHDVTARFIQHEGIDHVSFTGSVRGGREVSVSAAGRFINVGLELGGKDPAYVCGDAPFDFAVENCVDGAFYNAGQSCCAIERIYVEKAIYERFVEAFVAKVREYKLGDPTAGGTTIGPMASKGAIQPLVDQLRQAKDAGGKVVLEPGHFDAPGTGWFSAPGVVADARQDCALMQEESFGPVIGICAVSGDEEAVRRMNDSAYGLTASIWTSDLDRAIRVGEQVQTGTFFMNRCDYLDPALPWTGVKDTGKGATLSHYGFHHLTRLKSMHLRTELPS